MYTLEDKQNFEQEFEANLATSINSNELINEDLEALSVDVDNFSHYARMTVKNAVLAALPVGVPNPTPLVRSTISELQNGKARVSIVISSKKSSPVKYNYSKVFSGESLTPSKIVEFYALAIRRAVGLLMVSDNLVPLNDLLAKSGEEAGLPFSVSFAAPGTDVSAKFIKHISDQEVVFLASEDAILDRLPTLTLFREITDVSAEGEELTDQEKRLVAVRASLVNDLTGITTPVELLHSRIEILRVLAGITTHTPTTMIRGSVKRKIAGVGAGIKSDLEAIVETPEVIGIVERIDGEWSTLLSPVDKKTYEPSDFDLVAEAKRVVAA